MKKLTQYQVDAFATRIFEGNPAAIVPLESWLDDNVLQALAMENNLSETAYFVPENSSYRLRWFTPTDEVDLCGHATLAAAHILFQHLGFQENTIAFETRSGQLNVTRSTNSDTTKLCMNFPLLTPTECEPPQALLDALGTTPEVILGHDDYLVVLPDQSAVENLSPNLNLLTKIDRRGVIVTAPGNQHDFVSRFFAPKYGIPEDPATGSAHCILAAYWGNRLNKTSMSARQLSQRGAEVHCDVDGDRVTLTGQAVTVMETTVYLPES